jgi:hypothetical protein
LFISIDSHAMSHNMNEFPRSFDLELAASEPLFISIDSHAMSHYMNEFPRSFDLELAASERAGDTL